MGDQNKRLFRGKTVARELLVILAPSRWKLRAAIRLVNETLAELKVEQHPDKTFIGRVSRGV
jgi:hypothetical protein